MTMVKVKRNKFRLVEGVWYRWEGTKESGKQVLYTREQGNNVIENVTPAEYKVMRSKLKLVGGTPPIEGEGDEPIEQLDGEFEDLTLRKNAPTVTAGPKPATVRTPTPPTGDPDTDDDSDDAGDADSNVTEFNSVEEFLAQKVDDVVIGLESIDDIAQLRGIKRAEKRGAGRKGVMDAVDLRITALKE